MAATNPTELMHTVLDGEADQAQVRELNRVLATDPAARAEFESLQVLFTSLGDIPPHNPPEGMHARVMAAVDAAAHRCARRGRRQLFSLSRVFGSAPRVGASRTSEHSTTFIRSQDMSKLSSSLLGNRRLWIGGATAAAALVVWQLGFNQWPQEKDVMGTIAPAERYRAPQPGAADIKVEAPTAAATSRDAKPPVEVVEKSSAQATAADRTKADHATADKAKLDLATGERAKTDLAAADRATTERATADRATADRATADRATAERASADRAAADRAVQKAAELAAEKAAAARTK